MCMRIFYREVFLKVAGNFLSSMIRFFYKEGVKVMRQALIFDVDGTLWDTTYQHPLLYNEMFKKLGFTEKCIDRKTVMGFMGYTEEEIAAIIFPNLEHEERMKYLDMITQEECRYLLTQPGKLYPDVKEVLDYLHRKYELYIVSNCQKGYVETLYAAHGLENYFCDFECSGRTGLSKGDNIRFIMERNQLQTAVYIGDTLKDKEACDYAGIPFVYAAYGFGKVEEYAHKIDAFKDLMELF